MMKYILHIGNHIHHVYKSVQESDKWLIGFITQTHMTRGGNTAPFL